MTDGVVLIDRKLSGHALWLSELPAHESEAWVDLLLLANQTPSEIKTGKGEMVFLEKGQVGWSKLGLSKRWGWGQGKVGRYLDKLTRWGQVLVESTETTTVITIQNFCDYQSALLKIAVENSGGGEVAERSRRGDGDIVATEKGEGRRESLTRQGEGRRDCESNHPPENVILDHFRLSGADYSPDEVHQVWLDFEDAKDEAGQWHRLTKPYGLVVDWRSSVERQLAQRRQWADRPEKNAAKNTAPVSGAVQTIERRKVLEALQRELRELTQQDFEDRQGNMPLNMERRARIKQLRVDVADAEANV